MGLMPFKGAAPGEMTQPESAPPGNQPDSKYVDSGESNVSPEEQAEYETVVKNGVALIYDGKTVRPEVLNALKAEDVPDQDQGNAPSPPVFALANTAVQIVSKLDDSARQANQPISDDVLMHAGIAMIEELAEVADAAGIHDYTEDELSGALTVAMDMYRPKAVQDGRTTEDTLKGQFGEVVKADQEGRLGEVVPGADQQQPEEAEEGNGGR